MEKPKVGIVVLLLLLFGGCGKSVPAPTDPIELRYLACTAGLGDAFFSDFPKRWRHQAHEVVADCIKFHNEGRTP